MRPSSPLDTEYVYDCTPPSSSKASLRSSSPFHFLYPVMSSTTTTTTTTTPTSSSSPGSSSSITHPIPHSHSLSSSHHTLGGRGKRSSRKREQEAQEIARLLDPSYQSTSLHAANREGRRRSLEVYVDKDGDLHDPDFRYFPAAETFMSQTRKDPQTRRRSSGGSGAVSPPRRRPYWDYQDNEHALLSDEEEEEELLARELGSTDFLKQAGHGIGISESTSLPRRTPHTRRDGGGSFSSYGFSSYSGHTHSYYSPTMTTSTLPTSYESENTFLSSSEIEGEKDREKGLLKRRRRGNGEKEVASASGTAMVLETTREESSKEGAEDDHHHLYREEEEEEEIAVGDYVPTCTEALKRHWLSISLRLRFGIYRSQRRFMRRVHSLF